jgi:hypothetical protein
MSALAEIIEQMQDTESAMAHLEKSLSAAPKSESLRLQMQSVLKRREQLEEEFNQVSHQAHLDVCSYRLLRQKEGMKLLAVTGALQSFQTLFTTVVDALRDGPKQRARFDAGLVEQTAFEYGYSFKGSIGFVLTMPNERLLFGASDFDKAMEAIFEMAKTNRPDALVAYAKKYGLASIRKLYLWIVNHTQAESSAQIDWRRENDVKLSVFIATAEFQALQATIESNSEESEESLEITGRLVGVDVALRRFHMEVPDAEDIKGSVSPALGTRKTIEVPHQYTASLLKKTRIFYATEKEEVEYLLLDLR